MKKHNDQPIRDVLGDFKQQYKHKRKLDRHRVAQIWKEKMPSSIVGHTRDIKLIGKRLYLHVTSAPLREQLSYERPKIRDMFNREMGEEVIEEVILR